MRLILGGLQEESGRERRASRRLRDNNACLGLHYDPKLNFDRLNVQARIVSPFQYFTKP
ncbi:MAG: hypothetical protein JOY82_10080 [Streptosporangiaceae bacterium]|nr:hypothetical protein [Streptosporangiaceae bacterium]MBV9854858.1 hypothetical protein [Streptosporangiaceae bacterium]